jgi:hypothetical protein
MNVHATPGGGHGRHRAVRCDATNGGHGRKAGPIDGRGANRYPQRTCGRDDVDSRAVEIDGTADRTRLGIRLEQSDTPAGDPQSVPEEREALRCCATPATTPSRVAVFVFVSMP